MKKETVNLLQKRRSQYALNRDVSLSQTEIQQLIGEVLQSCPSAFYSQTQGIVLLFGKDHDDLWDIVLETLRKIVPAERFAPTEQKIAGFKAAYGTVLFFTDTAITDSLVAKFSGFGEHFPAWGLQENGMVQHAVWVALAENGIGASLQHYNPIIDEEVKARWGIAESWKLLAQMPFGHIVEGAQAKELLDLSKKMKVYGKEG